MVLSYSSSPFMNLSSFLHFVRGGIHLIVLASLIAYQFVFPLFIHAYLSVSLYSLCAVVLMADVFYLFIYRDNRFFNFYFSGFLIFLDVLFFTGLFFVLGLPALLFIMFLVFLEVVTLSVCRNVFSGFLFSFLLILSFIFFVMGYKEFSYEATKASMTLIYFGLLLSLIFGYLLNYLTGQWRIKVFQLEKALSDHQQGSSHKFESEISLQLAKKIKPALNSLIKPFVSGSGGSGDSGSFGDSAGGSGGSSEVYRSQLYQLRNFVLKYIDYLELRKYSFKPVHFHQFLKDLLKDFKDHKDRPSQIEEKIDYSCSEEWVDCSPEHMKQALGSILENSFQALKNQEEPFVLIKCYDEKQWVVLEFIDNGHGIDKEDKTKIFDPLFSKRLGLGGTGLAYAFKVIQAHQGQIFVSSSSTGTQVQLKLPIPAKNPPQFSKTA